MEVEHLRIADAYSWGVRIASSNIKHPNAGLGTFAVRAFNKGDSIGPY